MNKFKIGDRVEGIGTVHDDFDIEELKGTVTEISDYIYVEFDEDEDGCVYGMDIPVREDNIKLIKGEN